MDGSIKKYIVTYVESVFIYPLVVQLTEFGQVSMLTMLQHISTSYRDIDEIYQGGNAVKMIGIMTRWNL